MICIDSITVLHKFAQRRRYFDPANRNDLDEFKYFKQNSRWRDRCPFYLEWPFTDIISMCESKYAEYMLQRLK